MAIRFGLFVEVVAMALDTVRTNKMRSALTVLGVVIGITSIVGMTAMIRGFDESSRTDAHRPEHHYIQRFGITSFAGRRARELLKRPNLRSPMPGRSKTGDDAAVRRHRARRAVGPGPRGGSFTAN